MLRSPKPYPLNLKLPADEREKIDAGDDHVAAQDAGGLILDSKMRAESFENLSREKCDLALVVLPIVIKAIAANSVARDALDPGDLDQGVLIGRLPVVPEIIVAG